MCFSLLFSCYLKPDVTHGDCRTPDKKFTPVFLKCIFFSPEFHSGANPTIIILCYTFSVYFLRKWAPFLPEILTFLFPDFPFYTPKLYLLEYTCCSTWSYLMYKKHFYKSSVEFWTGFGYFPDFFIIFLLLLGTKTQQSTGGLVQWTLSETCEPHLEAARHQSKSLVEGHY